MLELAQEMLPEAGITELCVCGPHRDKASYGILCLGEFEGGALIWEGS